MYSLSCKTEQDFKVVLCRDKYKQILSLSCFHVNIGKSVLTENFCNLEQMGGNINKCTLVTQLSMHIVQEGRTNSQDNDINILWEVQV